MTREEILKLINEELKGIDKKYMGGKNKGMYPYPGHLFELISDENFEVAKAIVAKDIPALKKGLVNIAAVCFRVLEGLE